jgi:FemAB-related protein (PEP-CTERM system-associated)
MTTDQASIITKSFMNNMINAESSAQVTIHRMAWNNAQEEEAWDRFVRSSPDGTVFHLCAWKRAVEKAYRLTPHYLMARRGDEICAVLPLFEVKGLLSGHVLVSVTYGVYGGLCGSDIGARKALLEEAQKLAFHLRVRYVELRHLHDPEPDLPAKSLYVAFTKPLDPDPEVNFAAIPRKQRRMVRQGMKNGLEARQGWEHLEQFYDVFVVNKRRLGSPAFPLQQFEAVRDYFGQEAELLTIWHEKRLVAGVISFFYEDRVMPYYGASLPEAFSLAVNDFMYWELMREACLAGYKVFDFGRSREGTGSYDFKRHWGFEPRPLAYQYLLVNGAAIPDINPGNPRLQMFIETWKRLPIPVAKWIGPALTRWLPLD